MRCLISIYCLVVLVRNIVFCYCYLVTYLNTSLISLHRVCHLNKQQCDCYAVLADEDLSLYFYIYLFSVFCICLVLDKFDLRSVCWNDGIESQ